MKRGIVAYQNRKVIERDEEGGERAKAIEKLNKQHEMHRRVYGEWNVDVTTFEQELDQKLWVKPEYGMAKMNSGKQVNVLDVQRKFKVFEHQMVKYMAVVQGGQVWILAMESAWQVVDVLIGTSKIYEKQKKQKKKDWDDQVDVENTGELYHRAEQIECFDIAEGSKDIVTYSTMAKYEPGETTKTLVVYGLQDQGYLNGIDSAITQQMSDLTNGGNFGKPATQHLRWCEYWRCGEDELALHGFINTISISPLGDVLFLGGSECLSVWPRDDALASHSFTLNLYYAKELPKNMYAQQLKEVKVGKIIQSEFSKDGRSIVTLEEDPDKQNQRKIKVWYNNNAINYPQEVDKKEERLSLEDKKDPVKVQRFLLDLSSLEGLEAFELPKKQGIIQYFRLHDIPLSMRHPIQPIMFLAVTENSAHLWCEDMSLPPDFTLHQQVQASDQDAILQAQFSNFNKKGANTNVAPAPEAEMELDTSSKYCALTFSCAHTFALPQRSQSQAINEGISACFIHPTLLLKCQTWQDPDPFARSPLLNPRKCDKVLKWKIRQVLKLFDGMADEFPIGKTDFIDYVMIISGKKYWTWEVKGARSQVDLTSPGLQVKMLQQKDVQIQCDQKLADTNLSYFQPRYLFLGEQNSIDGTPQNDFGISQSNTISLYCLSQSMSFLKLSSSITEKESPLILEDARQSTCPLMSSQIVFKQVERNLMAYPQPLVAILKQQKNRTFIEIFTAADLSNLTTERNGRQLGDGLKQIGYYIQNDFLNKIRWVPDLAQLLVLSSKSGGELQFQLIASSTLVESLVTFSYAKESDELGQFCRDASSKHPIQGFENIKGEYGQAAIITLSPSDSEEFVDYQITSSKFKRNQELNKIEQIVEVLLFFRKRIQFHKITIEYKWMEREGPVVNATSNRLWSKYFGESIIDGTDKNYQKLGKVLATRSITSKGSCDELSYVENLTQFKALLLLMDKDEKYYACFFEIELDSSKAETNKLNLSWKQPIPWQVGNAPSAPVVARVDPRGNKIPAPKPKVNQEKKPIEFVIEAQISDTTLSVIIQNKKRKIYQMHVLAHSSRGQFQSKYKGQIDILSILEFGDLDGQELTKQGLFMTHNQLENGLIAIACLDRIYLLGEDQLTHKWHLVHVVSNTLYGMDVSLIKKLSIIDIGQQRLTGTGGVSFALLINDRKLQTYTQQLQNLGSPSHTLQNLNDARVPISHLAASLTRSHRLHSTASLYNLFIQGKSQYILRLLICFHKIIQKEKDNFKFKLGQLVRMQEQGNSSTDCSLLELFQLSLKETMADINEYVASQVVQQDEKDVNAAGPSKDTKAAAAKKKAAFGDFFGGDSDDDDFDMMGDAGGGIIDFDNIKPMDFDKKKNDKKKKEEEEKKKNQDPGMDQQFAEIKDELLKNIALFAAQGDLLSDKLLKFIVLFTTIYTKDFFSDEMASTLLRQIYMETEEVDEAKIKELKEQAQENINKVLGLDKKIAQKVDEIQRVKVLDEGQIYAQVYGDDQNDFQMASYQKGDRVNFAKLGTWDSRKCALALYSVNQDVILDELKDRFDIQERASWNVIRNICLPIWLKDGYKLKLVVEWVAKMAYKQAQDNMTKKIGTGAAITSLAESTALWYVLINKVPVLKNLYSKEKGEGEKVAELLSRDFTTERWSKAAIKNAWALKKKHRYELSATFSILGGDYELALQIIVDLMKDPILAILACRCLLLQKQNDPKLEEQLYNLYQEHFVDRGRQFGDIYLQSIGLWGQKKYIQAVNTLETKQDLESRQKCLGAGEIFNGDESCIQVSKEFSIDQQEVVQNNRDNKIPRLCDHVGFELLILVTKLRKAPLVTHALKKDNKSTGYGADSGDIFADFFGAQGGAAANQPKDVEADKKKIEIKDDDKLVIKDARILNQVLTATLYFGDLYQALFILRENRELIDASDEDQINLIQRVAIKILSDQILEIGQNPTFLNSEGSFEKQIDIILNFILGIGEQSADKSINEQKTQQTGQVSKISLKVDKSGELNRDQQLIVLRCRLRRSLNSYTLRILEDLHSIPRVDQAASPLINDSKPFSLLSSEFLLLRYELELRLDAKQRESNSSSLIGIPQNFCSNRTIMARLERQTTILKDLILSHSSLPFLETFGNRMNQSANLFRYRQIILELEQHVDCMIIWDHQDEDKVDGARRSENDGNEGWNEQILEMLFYAVKKQQDQQSKIEDDGKKDSKAKEQKGPAKKFDMFDDLMGGDDDSDCPDLMDFDFSAPPKPQQSVLNAKKSSKETQNDVISCPKELCSFKFPAQSYRARLSSKMRSSLIMHLTLLVLAYLTNKFFICKDILSQDNFGNLARVYQSIKSAHQAVQSFDQKIRQKREELKAILRGEQPEMQKHLGPKLTASPQKIKGEIEQLQIQRAETINELENKMKEECSKLHFQGLKTYILKFKCSIEKKILQIQQLLPNDQSQQNDADDDASILMQQIPQSSNDFEENLYQDKWETLLLNSEVKVQGDSRELGDVSQNPEDLVLGQLSRRSQIVPESYQFIRLWLKFIVCNTIKFALQEQLLSSGDGPKMGLAGIYDSEVELRLQDSKNVEGPWKNCNESLYQYMLTKEIQFAQHIALKNRIQSKYLLDNFTNMSRLLEEQCTIMFRQRLNVIQRLCISQEVRLLSGPLSTPPYLFKPFFKNIQKLSDFWSSFQVAKKFSKPLCDQYLTLLGQNNSSRIHEEEMVDKLILKDTQQGTPQDTNKQTKVTIAPTATQVLQRDMLGSGIELFKQRTEMINDFAFDNSTHTDNIALGLMTSGIREFPVVNTLRFRNRIENGKMLIDEENLKWEECLHRYDQIEQILNERQGSTAQQERQSSRAIEPYQKDEPIILAIDSLHADKSIFSRYTPVKQGEFEMNYFDLRPPEMWNGTSSQNYLVQQSKLGITHEDPSYAVESHPHLPLYVTGNRKGILCTWKFGQSEDKSLSQFMPEIDPRQADIKRACIKTIRFNSYGDKIMSNNQEGSFTIYQVECHSKNMKKVPIFSLYDNVDAKVTDFDLVNHDNVICTISQRQKTIKIYDTLLPYCFGRQAQVMDTKLRSGGNIILCNQRKQVLYIFNARAGAVSELDMRKNLMQINQYQLSQSQEVTAAVLNPTRDSLVTGYKDGNVKIHRIDQSFIYSEALFGAQNPPLREKITAFPFDFRGKKGQVSSIKFNQKNGGLYASSQAGVLKLLRTSV